MKSLLEASVDLENLRNKEDYIFFLDAISLKEMKQFFNVFEKIDNKDFENLKYLKKTSIKKTNFKSGVSLFIIKVM